MGCMGIMGKGFFAIYVILGASMSLPILIIPMNPIILTNTLQLRQRSKSLK